MSCKIKTRISQIVVLSLMIAIVAMFMPQMAAPVYADEYVPQMVPGTKTVLKRYVNTDKAQTVWYGDNGAWRVISYDGEGNEYTNPSGAMTLFASGILGYTKVYNELQEKNAYKDSDLQRFVDELYGSLFSKEEKQAVIERELIVHNYWGVSREETTGYLWPLSTAEADCLPSDKFRSAEDFWWLRSPGCADIYLGIVDGGGDVRDVGVLVNDIYGVRPAFNLNLDAVLFTSASGPDDGKYSGPLGADALEEVSAQDFREWKLTLKDDGTVKDLDGKPITGLSGHKNFRVTEYTVTGYNAYVTYTGARTGWNEYISAIITDRPITEENANIILYGRIKNCTSDDDASGTVKINAKDELDDNFILYVFNEQCNERMETDYASALYEVDPYSPVGRVKAANPLKIKARTAKVKYSKLKKKSQTLTVTKVIKFTKDIKDQKTYKLSSVKKGKKSFSKYFKINKTTGKVTVKKGLEKGTYKVNVKVQAKGNSRYKASKVMPVTFKIKVK